MWSMVEYDGAQFARMSIEVSEPWNRMENGVPVCSVDTYALIGRYIFQRPNDDFAGKKVAVLMRDARPMAACLIAGGRVQEACYLQHDSDRESFEIARRMRDYVRTPDIRKMQGLSVFGFVLTSRGGIVPAEDISEESIAKEVVPPQTAAFVRAYQASARGR
ncbi:MAG: hypothetical protein PHX68_04225 [Alphaproteobacteria bacterium]|nr:hypothetical protein [Alphaproteobacteria bacterium]